MAWVLTFTCEECSEKYQETTPVPEESQNYCKKCRKQLDVIVD